MLVGLVKVQPLYYKEETAIAKLGNIAGSKDPSNSKSLIVLESSYPDPELFNPALVFYSNRPVTSAESLEDLVKHIKDSQTHEVILTEKDLENLEKNYEFKIIYKVQL